MCVRVCVRVCVYPQGLANVPQLESLLKQLPAINVDLGEFSAKLKQVRCCPVPFLSHM